MHFHLTSGKENAQWVGETYKAAQALKQLGYDVEVHQCYVSNSDETPAYIQLLNPNGK